MNSTSHMIVSFIINTYTCLCATTVAPVGLEAAAGGCVGRDTGTNGRLPTELLELGLGGVGLSVCECMRIQYRCTMADNFTSNLVWELPSKLTVSRTLANNNG